VEPPSQLGCEWLGPRWGHRGRAPQTFYGGRMAKVVIETVAKHIEALKSQRLMGSYGVLTIKYGVLVEFKCQICFFLPSNGDRAGK